MIYYPQKTDIFRATILRKNEKSFDVLLYVKSFKNGIPHLIRVGKEVTITEEFDHDVVKDQLREEYCNTKYIFLCTTGEKDSNKALDVATDKCPEYFI